MSVKSHLSSNSTLASARQITSNEVNLILKLLNTRKAPGTDQTPAKLVKLASDFLSTPLATAINNSHASSKFPDIAKVATLIPIDKKTDDKYDISNFRPVSLLNCFSKVYENIKLSKLNFIGQLFEEKKLKPWNELKEEFSLANTDHFKYMQLCNAIPSSWKTSLLKDSENTHGLVLYEPHIVRIKQSIIFSN